jgi:hypothetical protein
MLSITTVSAVDCIQETQEIHYSPHSLSLSVIFPGCAYVASSCLNKSVVGP